MQPKRVWKVTEQMPDGTWNEWDIDYDTRRQAKLAVRAMGKDKTKTLVAPKKLTKFEELLKMIGGKPKIDPKPKADFDRLCQQGQFTYCQIGNQLMLAVKILFLAFMEFRVHMDFNCDYFKVYTNDKQLFEPYERGYYFIIPLEVLSQVVFKKDEVGRYHLIALRQTLKEFREVKTERWSYYSKWNDLNEPPVPFMDNKIRKVKYYPNEKPVWCVRIDNWNMMTFL